MKLTRLPSVLTAAALLFAAQLVFANSAIDPQPRDEAWVERHRGFVEIAKKGGVDLLFVGDSITDGWRKEAPKGGKEIWDARYAPLNAANFGIGGDRTQHVLWRLQNGELEGITPRAVVLMIGTNNTGFERDKTTPRNSSTETVEGVRAIVDLLRAKLPAAKILLLAVFPRAETPDHPQRKQVDEINAGIAKLHNGQSIHFLDIGKGFLTPDGVLKKELMPDFLHPNDAGYRLWAEAIDAPLKALLK